MLTSCRIPQGKAAHVLEDHLKLSVYLLEIKTGGFLSHAFLDLFPLSD